MENLNGVNLRTCTTIRFFFQQDELIRQLQEQHFQQYMQQVYQQQLLRNVSEKESIAVDDYRASFSSVRLEDKRGPIRTKYVLFFIISSSNTRTRLDSIGIHQSITIRSFRSNVSINVERQFVSE